MYRRYGLALQNAIHEILQKPPYEVSIDTLVIEEPPRIEFGEYALPIAFELAKRLKKAPRVLAAGLAEKLTQKRDSGWSTNINDSGSHTTLDLNGFATFTVAGAGYINCKLDRAAGAGSIANGERYLSPASNAIIEHTSINPNKAAHVGHLRNAILGDTLARMMRWGLERPNASYPHTMFPPRVQNYIDNTGVQVADIVVALTHLEGKNLAAVEQWKRQLEQRGERIDFACWDLYARVSQWYTAEPEQSEARKKIRLDTLHALEEGGNEAAEIAELVSTAIVRRHLQTMERLGIEYDLLPRESEVLRLHFWDAAFALMKEKGVLYQETEGKNAGCWVMRRTGTEGATGDGPDEEAKVIVRSNGTVTYVGKDIAYHLWKFAKIDKDFQYKQFYTYPERMNWVGLQEARECYVTSTNGDSVPVGFAFNNAKAIYNVIDSRQTDPQNNVIEALRGMGFTNEAENYHHVSYEMVALTPRCAEELGYTLSDEDRARPFIEVSGRKGFGVKADDLIDKMEAAALAEVTARHPELSEEERKSIASTIAVGALRYYMLRYTRNTLIAFDYKDALSFEGETGPYAQYAAVRAANIFRKANMQPEDVQMSFGNTAPAAIEDSIWTVWLAASKSNFVIDQSIRAMEPAYLAKYVFQLAQSFNNFYHQHHILTESDPDRKNLLLATAAVALRELKRSLRWLGIEAPDVM